jgi:hypothetical protein
VQQSSRDASDEKLISRSRETMIEFVDFVALIHQVNETFGTALDWLSDTCMNVGLVAVIWVGYLRHWVSFAAQCHHLHYIFS